MQIISLQNSFTTGEMDPKLRARSDIDQYRSGLAKATNVTIQPQGGAKRRPGSRYVATLPGNASQGVRMIPFEFSTTTSYMLVFVPGRMYVFKDGALVTGINGTANNYLAISGLTGDMISSMCWTQSYDTLILVHEDLAPLKVFRGGSDTAWTASTLTIDYTPKYAFTITTSNPAATLTPSDLSGKITLTASASVFTAAHVGQYVNNLANFGRARIIEYVSGTSVKARVEVPFFDKNAIAASSWELETGYENVWSATRGYPRSVAFYGGRLFFGGSKSRPSTVWGSRVGDYFNFNPGEALADDAIEATADTGQYNAIVDIYSGRALQVFTVGAEFFVPQPVDEPITPANFSLKVQTENGSRVGTRVVNVEGGTIFVQRQGKALAEFVYTNTEAAYTSAKISLLSSHLLKDPVEVAIRNSTSTDEGDRLLVVNGEDGTIACYTLLRSQKVIAPSEWVTDGKYVSVGVVIDTAYAVVKRRIINNDAYYVEVFDDNMLLDCTTYVAQPDIEDLSEMEGYAAYANTTGGNGYETFYVNNNSDDVTRAGSLRWACKQAELAGGGKIAFVGGSTLTITLGSSIYIPSNTTIDGLGSNITITSADTVSRFRIDGANNVIVRRLNITSTTTAGTDKRDGITIIPSTADRIWINRCSFSNCGDGCIDAYNLTALTTTICRFTISYCRFSQHDKTILIGTAECYGLDRDETACASMLTSRRTIYASLHRNYFATGQRNPRVAGPVYAHVWNNVYDLTQYDGGAVYGIWSTTGARVFVEANHFTRVSSVGTYAAYAKTTASVYDPATNTYTDGPGAIRGLNNVVDAYLSVVDANESYVPNPVYDYTAATASRDLIPVLTTTVYPTSSSNLAYLEQKTVKVIRDGVLEEDKVVTDGAITLDRMSTADYQIGLNYVTEIKTLPVAPKTQAGSLRGAKKRVFDVIVDLFETKSLNVQNREIAFRRFGGGVLDQPPEAFTGLKRVDALLGYDRDGTITITQSAPLPMTVLGIEYKVSVG